MANIHTTKEFLAGNMTPVYAISNIENTPNKSMAKHEEDDDDVNLRREFRYIFRTMAAFGLYHTPKAWRKHGPDGSNAAYTLQQVYCNVISLLVFLHGVKSCIGLWYSEGKLLAMQIVMTAWWFMCAANYVICYFMFNTNNIPELFYFWQKRCQSSPHSHVLWTSVRSICVRRRKWIIFGCALGFLISNTLFASFARFGPLKALRNDTIFMVVPRVEPFIVWDFVEVITAAFGNAAFVLPPAFLLILCSIVSRQFHQFTKNFYQCLTDEERRFSGCLVALRRQHQYLCKVVFALDDSFSFYLAVTFGGLVILCCFLMYQLVVAQNFTSFMTAFLGLFWLSSLSVLCSLIGMITAQVHVKAHEIVSYIHDIGVFGFQESEGITQMNMFMAKLNRPPIALTLWGIVPLTKEFLLTVVGVFITYFALMAQTF